MKKFLYGDIVNVMGRGEREYRVDSYHYEKTFVSGVSHERHTYFLKDLTTGEVIEANPDEMIFVRKQSEEVPIEKPKLTKKESDALLDKYIDNMELFHITGDRKYKVRAKRAERAWREAVAEGLV